MVDTVKLEIIVGDKGSLVIKNFKDVVGKSMGEVTSQTEASGSAVTGLWKKIALGDLVASGIKSSYAAFVGVLKDSAGEYMRAEEGNAALRQTLVNLGDASEGTYDALDKYAAQIQRTTVVDDDMAKSLMQLGLNMGIPIKQIGGATEAAIGLTKAFKGMSLDNAMKATAAAFEGNTQKLQRYIPELKETATASEKMAIVQKAMADGLKIAHNEITTGAGQLKQFQNDWGDVKESIGKVLVEALLPLAAGFKEFFDQNKDLLIGFVQSLVTGFTSLVEATEWVIGALGKLLGFIQKLSPLINAMVNGWKNLLVLFTNELSDVYDKLGESINREAEMQKKSIERFRQAATAVKATKDEIHQLVLKYNDSENAGIMHERMLRDLIKTHPELAAKLKATAEAGKGVQVTTNSMNNGFDLNIPKTKELAKAHEILAEKIEREHSVWYQMQGTMKLMPGALKDNTFAVRALDNSMDANKLTTAELDSKYEKLVKTEADVAAATDANGNLFQELNAMLQFSKALFEGLGNALPRVAGGFLGIAQGVMNFTGALETTTTTVDGVESSFTSLKGGVTTFLSIGLGVVETLNEAFGNWYDNMEVWVEDMLDKKKRAAMTQADLSKEIWTQIVDLGFEEFINSLGKAANAGTAEVIGLIEEFKDLATVQAYIKEQLAAGVAGYKAMKDAMDPGDLKEKYAELIASMKDMKAGSDEYKAAQEELAKLKTKIDDVRNAQDVFGKTNIQVYDDMIAYEEKIAANPALTSAIAGATQALIGLSNTTRLSQTDFDQFQQSAASAFDKLTANGFTSKEAYQQLAPMLARLKMLHEEYGLTLDAETEKLLKGADAAGVNTTQAMSQEEAFGRMTGALEQMVVLMGGTLPAAAGTAATAIGAMTSNATTDVISLSGAIGQQVPGALGELSGSVEKTFAVMRGDVGALELQLSKGMPAAYADMVMSAKNAFDSTGNTIENFSDKLDKATRDRTMTITVQQIVAGIKPAAIPPIAAATGFEGVVAGGSYTHFVTGEDEPEYVSITPMSKMPRGYNSARSGGDSKQSIIVEDHSTLTIYVDPKSGIDQTALAETLNTIIKDNRMQIADTMATAVARRL